MCCAPFTPSPCGLLKTAPDEILFSAELFAHDAAQSQIQQAGKDNVEPDCVWETSLSTVMALTADEWSVSLCVALDAAAWNLLGLAEARAGAS